METVVAIEGERAQSARYFAYSKSLLIGVLLAAVSFSFLVVALLGVVGLLLFDRVFGWMAICGLGAYIALRIVREIHGRGCNCQLCHGPVLSNKNCNKHRDARRYPLMSYRRSLLIDAAVKGQFNCMYCGTPYRLWR